MEPRTRLHEDHIIDATWALVARGGFEALTMRELANELGVAHGSVKYYFQRKDALLEAALGRLVTTNRDRVLQRIADSEGIVSVRRILVEGIPEANTDKPIAPIVVASWGRMMSSPTFREILSQINLLRQVKLEEALEQARSAGELHEASRPLRSTVIAMVTLIAGLQPMSMLFPDDVSTGDMVDVVDAYLDGLVTPQGRDALDRERARNTPSGENGTDELD